MTTSTKKPNLLWPALWLALFLGGPVHADDTEVFLQGAPEGAGTSLMFMIDTAGAGNRQTVIEDLAAALNRVIDRTSGNTKMGLSRYYSGGEDGSYVAHPVKSMLDLGATESESFVSAGDGDVYHDGAPVVPASGTFTNCAIAGGQFPCPEATRDGSDQIVPDGTSIKLGGRTHDRAGFVFPAVSVPRYARITEAYIQVQPTTTGTSEGIGVDTYRLDEMNPDGFTTGDNLFAPGVSQTSSGSCEKPDDFSNDSQIWQCSDATAGKGRVKMYKAEDDGKEVARIPVTDLLQDAVKEQYWCGQQSLALAIGTADTSFEFHTYEAAAAENASLLAPKLYVKWDPSSADRPAGVTGTDAMSCSGGVRLDLATVTNDVMENTSDNLITSDSALIAGNADQLTSVTTSNGGGGGGKGKGGGNKNTNSISSGNYEIGLRFPNVNFGPDARFGNALLHYQIKEVVGSDNLIIDALRGDTGEQNSSGEVTSATSVASTSISHAATTTESRVSVDVTSLVNAIVTSAGWAKGAAMGLRLRSGDPNNYSVRIGALEDGNASAAYLTMDVLSNEPADFVPTNRDALKEQVLGLASAKGGGKSKFAQAYMDASTYMRNGPVLTGDLYYSGGGLSTREAEWADEIFATKYDDYAGPVGSVGVCEKRHTVMLAQGNVNDHPQDVVEKATEGAITTAECGSDYYGCMKRYSAWSAALDTDIDASPLPDIPVITHIVGFQLKSDQEAGFKEVAEASGGEFRNAQSIAEVEAAFQEIVDRVTVENASLAAPGVAVNQLNRFMHLDQLYYSVFKPDFTERWNGNMKRYRLAFKASGPVLVDQNGNPAVEKETGFFKENSQSFWSDTVDGNQAVLGGARAEVDLGAYNRPLWVSSGSNPAPGTDIDATSPVTGSTLDRVDEQTDLAATDYGLASGADTSTAFNFVMRGWGDPLHSEPRLVTYNITDNGDGTFDQDNTVFVSTNDGALHAIDADDGSEDFVFMPQEELVETADRLENAELSDPFNRSAYGLDSTWTTWRFKDSSNNVRVFLFGGQRRGGDKYYAIDASDRSNPKLMWVIDGSSGKFAKLGQTWSRPTFSQVSINGTDVPVLVFGGGYDSAAHDTSGTVSTGDTEGDAVFMVNANNGALIWSASSDSISGGGDHDTVSEMKWSIPSDIAVVDIDFDGRTDHLYFTDLGGQVFRADINNGNSGVSGLVRRVIPLAQLGVSSGSTGYADHRRLYSAPTIALGERNGAKVLHVAFGSGYRAHPLEKGLTQDRIYVVDDSTVFDADSGTYSTPAVLGHADLLNVTNNTSPTDSDFSGKDGWYIDLDKSIGEKMIAGATVLQGKLFLTTYVPEEDDDTTDCAPIAGRSRLYTVNIADGSPVDVDNDGTIDERYQDGTTRGLASQPQIIIGEQEPVDLDGDGVPDEPTGPCGGKGELAVVQGTAVTSGGQLKGCGIQKTRWYQADDGDEANDIINGLTQ